MRSTKLFFILGAVFSVIALITLAGCSDDDATTTPVQDDTAFSTVQDQTNGYIDSTLVLAANALQTVLIANANGDTSIPAEYGSVRPDTVIAEAGWLVVIVEDLATAYSFQYRDSIQFRKGGVAQAYPRGAEEASVRHTWSFASADTTLAFRNYDVTGIYEFTGLNANQAVINGTSTYEAQARRIIGGQLRTSFSMEATLTEVTFNRADEGWQLGRPESGTVTVNATLVIHGDTDATTEWTVEITFDNGTMTAEVTTDAGTQTYTRTL